VATKTGLPHRGFFTTISGRALQHTGFTWVPTPPTNQQKRPRPFSELMTKLEHQCIQINNTLPGDTAVHVRERGQASSRRAQHEPLAGSHLGN